MKKTIYLFLFFVLAITKVQGQKIHFTDSNNHWITTGYDCNFTPVIGYYWYTKDTIMDGYLYRFLRDSFNDYGFYPLFDTVFGKWVREDTLANIVYAKYNDTDRVLYNFSRTLNSTSHYDFLPPPYYYIDSVRFMDSTVINSIKYKVFHIKEIDHYYRSTTLDSLCYVDHRSTFMEGIGSFYNPLFPINTLYAQYNQREVLHCFYQADTPSFSLLYIWSPDFTTRTYINCDSALSIPQININTRINIDVFPNPANSTITIYVPKNGIISICSMVGKNIYIKTINNNAKYIDIDISNFVNGLYFIKLQTEDGIILNNKFIKQ